jgi:uncharacterized UPF0160 family protein
MPAQAEPEQKRRRIAPVAVVEPLLERLNSVKVVSAPSKDQGVKRIGTHDGTFHCDEALACAMLLCLPEWSGDNIELVRTRNQEFLDACDIVVDVGAVYVHEKKRYDHHQREFTDTMKELERDIKLSSAGLVYRHYGKDILKAFRARLDEAKPQGYVAIPDTLVDKLYQKVYTGFIEHIDGIDNGVNAFDGKMKYAVTTSLSARVGGLNPRWNEDYSSIEGGERGFRNMVFVDAMKLTLREVFGCFENFATSWWPARAVVEGALKEAARKAVHPSGKVAELPSYAPWQSHVFDLEAEGFEGLKEGDLLFMLFPDSMKGSRIQCVGMKDGGFENLRPFRKHGVACATRSARRSLACQAALSSMLQASLVVTTRWRAPGRWLPRPSSRTRLRRFFTV